MPITRRQRQRLVGACVLVVATRRFLARCECDIEALAACTWRRGRLYDSRFAGSRLLLQLDRRREQ